MKLSLETLQVLDAIDRKGSFAAAATELHRVPSAITYSVRQLEEGLGVSLFDRNGRRAVLTEAGRELLSEGRRLLRAAADLECRVQQVASGWEAELRIALDTVIGIEKLFGLVEELYAQKTGTRVRILHEVLGGTWDAIASGRADIAVGAPGDAPPGRNYSVRSLGRVPMAFVAAPFHPICREPQPLADEVIQAHRAVSVADSSRMLEPRTVGLLSGQDTLTVPSMEAKAAAHVAGLGVGFLPRWIAEREALAGRLRILSVAAERAPAELLVAWRPGKEGKALRWLVKRLEDPLVAAELLS
ncbi:MAG TPA: LysR family transcriptional regulator [Usitatibacter sp.]|nr:LysR family transcriptional regulator [Usitatibacter sp.]